MVLIETKLSKTQSQHHEFPDSGPVGNDSSSCSCLGFHSDSLRPKVLIPPTWGWERRGRGKGNLPKMAGQSFVPQRDQFTCHLVNGNILVHSRCPVIGCFTWPVVLMLYALLKIRASALSFGKCYKSPARNCSRSFPQLKGERKLKSLLHKLQHMPTP